MIYQAKILHLNDDVEEEVVIKIGNVELICFASFCPCAIEVGLFYEVELSLAIFDDYEVKDLNFDAKPSIDRIGNGLAYVVTGKLRGDNLESGDLIFQDEVLQRDFSFFDGKMIAVKVDRIDAEFQPCRLG